MRYKHDVKVAKKRLEEVLRPGDVINTDGYDTITNPLAVLTHRCIRLHQKKLFGPTSDYRDTHTMCYFGRNHIFSVTSPVAMWDTIEEQARNRFTVLRYSHKKELTDEDISIMLDAANIIIGTKYDYGQLLDIALNHILGYKFIRKAKIFDLGARRMVCSVGVRALFEKRRYVIRARYGQDNDGGDIVDRLFHKLNPARWAKEDINNFVRSDVELTCPGHFNNSEWYEREFTEVLNWKMFL